jgi:hypothetical protein
MTGETVTEGPAGFEVAHGRLTVERIYLKPGDRMTGSPGTIGHQLVPTVINCHSDRSLPAS